MKYDFDSDDRLDPRIKRVLVRFPEVIAVDVENRDQLLAEAASPEGLRAAEMANSFLDRSDNEEVAPSTGLLFSTVDVVSAPDGNIIKLQIVRPEGVRDLACVYYIHGGKMATLSSFLGNYKAWARILASKGVAVVMVEFRNAVAPSAVPETAPFPGGLNDCASGLAWIVAHAEELSIDRSRVVVAGESGGGNLTLALALKLKGEGNLGTIKGLYAMCPSLTGLLPDPRFPSSTENNGILLNMHSNRGVMGYGIEAFQNRNPMAWPGFAKKEDLVGFPPTVISVNECDPLRDEGIAFYRLLLSAGVAARGRMVLGTAHGTEVIPTLCPDVSHSTAIDIAAFAGA